MDILPISCVSGDDVQNSIDDVDHLLRNINDEVYFRLLPPGYIFNPTDEELIVEYLDKKVKNLPLPRNKINCVNIYNYNPETLCQMFKGSCGYKEWYFFTPRKRKYRNGKRPNRAAGNGYWKATGADKEILESESNTKVGCRKALVFYMGKPPNGQKTPWIMHEYRVEDCPECDRSVDAMKLDEWVLCRIYNKMDKNSKNNNPTTTSSSSKGKQKLVEKDEDEDEEEDEEEDKDEDKDVGMDDDDDVPENICGGSNSNTTRARSNDQNRLETSSSYDHNHLPIHMIAPLHASSSAAPTYHPHMWNQLIPLQTSTSKTNIMQLQMRSYPSQNQLQLLSGSQWQQQPPPPPTPYEENLQQQQHDNNVLIHHHNNPFPENYCHLENTTSQAAQVQVAPAAALQTPHNPQAPQPSINANLHLPYQHHNWQFQAPHPSFNADHPYYQHNSAAPQPASIAANNYNIPYQQHNSELEAPQPSINGNTTTTTNNNPHHQQNYSQAPQPNSQAPQPSNNNANNTTQTQTADDDDDEEYDTDQFLV